MIEQASRHAIAQKTTLRGVLLKEAKVTKHLSAADLDRLFEPANYLGAAEQMVARVLAVRPVKKK